MNFFLSATSEKYDEQKLKMIAADDVVIGRLNRRLTACIPIRSISLSSVAVNVHDSAFVKKLVRTHFS